MESGASSVVVEVPPTLSAERFPGLVQTEA